MTFGKVRILIILLITIGAAVPTKNADPVPPPYFPFHAVPPYTLKEHPALSVNLGSLNVRFLKTNLKEVQKVIGPGEIHARGDAAENTLWLCYSNSDKENRWRIWLMSSGEMDKPEGRISGIVAKTLPRGESTPACPVLPTMYSRAALNNRIWLDAKQADVLKELGEPSLRNDGWFRYGSNQRFWNDLRAKAWRGEDWIEIGELSLRFRRGTIQEDDRKFSWPLPG